MQFVSGSRPLTTTVEVMIINFANFVLEDLRPTIKNCWFAVLLPTRQNWPYPKKFMAILRKIFFFFQKSKNKDSFSQNYSFQNLFYVLTMFYYAVLTSIYPILNHIHLLI